MMAALAHQIRTPLASALLHATNLQSFPHETERLAPQLVERLRSLDELVNGMLSFARQGALAVTRITLPMLLKNFLLVWNLTTGWSKARSRPDNFPHSFVFSVTPRRSAVFFRIWSTTPAKRWVMPG